MTDNIQIKAAADSGGHTHGDGSGGAHTHPDPVDPSGPGQQSGGVFEDYAAYSVAEGVTVNVNHPGGVQAGVMQAVGTLIAISTVTTEAEENNAMAVEGVFAVPNADGLVFTQGDAVNVDLAGQKAVAVGTGVSLGVCWQDAAATDSHVIVKINAG